MQFGNHVGTLDLTQFEQIIPDAVFREQVLIVHITKDTKLQFDVLVTTTAGMVLQSTFTVLMLVQLSNQSWIKSITKDSVFRPC